MSQLVIDASVAIKWYLPEPGADEALLVLDDLSASLLAPDLIRAEIGQVLWKRWRQGLIDQDEALEILHDFLAMPITILAADDLVRSAWQFAARTGATVYDGLYLAAASHYDAVLVTADRSLAQRASTVGVAVRSIVP